MKKLLALSITLVSGLTGLQANDVAGAVGSMKSSTQTNCDNSCAPCKPCCVPQPKKCINCECYVPSYYDLQCDWGMTSYADFLYWYSNESNLPFAMVVTTVPQNPTATTSSIVATTTKHVGTNWDPGFRVGGGWNTGYDGWDVDANYTWYHNRQNKSVSVPNTFSSGGSQFLPGNGQQAIVDPWIDAAVFSTPATADPQFFLVDTVQANWKLMFNQVDLDIGRKYWLSKRFTMRPYAGGRGAWATTMFRNRAVRTSTTDPLDFTDTFKNKFWGVGLMTGFQPEWHVTSCFSIFSNLDASLLWGRFKLEKDEDYSRPVAPGATPIQINNSFYTNFSKMTTMVDLAFGFRWTENWCNDRFRAYFDAGWEHHIWFDVNNRLKTSNSNLLTGLSPGPATMKGFGSFEEEVGNLSFGGLVIRARLDY